MRYEVEVVEVRHVRVVYVVEADSEDEATVKAADGETIEERDNGTGEVWGRIVTSVEQVECD